MPRTISYLRVSRDTQDMEKDRIQVQEFVEKEHLPTPIIWYEDDGVSTKLHWKKRKTGLMIEEMKEGDVLVVTEISRLARDVEEIIEIYKAVSDKKIIIHVIKNNLRLDDSLSSKIMITIFGLGGEIERDLIRQRTRDALRTRRENGLKLGRPSGAGASKLDAHRSGIEQWLREGKPKAWIARTIGTSISNFHGYIKKRNINIVPDIKHDEKKK